MNVLFSLIVISAFLMVAGKRIDYAIWLMSLQGFLLALIGTVLGLQAGNGYLYASAFLLLIVKGILVPAALFYIVRKIQIRREIDLVFSPNVLFLLAAGLVLLSYWVVSPQILPSGLAAKSGLPVALSLLLIGLLIMITRKVALSQLIGLLIMENGLSMAAMAVSHGMPLMVELGIFFDLLVAVLIMGLFLFRIDKTFGSINTDKLKSLKG
ncbi:hypothetical protein MFMK1_000535 [Metallumcola ferriviriculae]|uniref:Uncharacterized protein n=1 Tax=Metallumcola ferriviriculae TaxID=3039180 RepID=A0AAU0UKC0_9FIRM|nr:hypothetical protein MFMK1_000535 [Desulfitibacteraceae bacterium MK1]